jgi:hypothetical protein
MSERAAMADFGTGYDVYVKGSLLPDQGLC